MKTRYSHNPIRIVVICIGCLCALSGIEHGFFEMLQGSQRIEIHNIDGHQYIFAIGESIRFWKYGFEYAYTIIPNYLLTGIITICISILLIYWTLTRVQLKLGWLVFIVLSILQYLTGGGAAQLGLAILVGLFAILINKQFILIGKLPILVTKMLINSWPIWLIIFVVIFLQSIVTAIFGFLYWIHDADKIIKVQFSMIYIMLSIFAILILSTLFKTHCFYQDRK
jgi:hypothetical protein